MSERVVNDSRSAMRVKVLWITRTALFIALLVTWQAVTAPLSTFVTGSGVNMILAVAVMTCGLFSGIAVSAVSPVMAATLGIAPNWVFVPFIAAGNIVFVILWYFIGNMDKINKYAEYVMAMAAAAVAKFLVLYIGVARIAIPVILNAPEPQASRMAGMFSLPQLVTATIGGVLAIAVFPTLRKAIK